GLGEVRLLVNGAADAVTEEFERGLNAVAPANIEVGIPQIRHSRARLQHRLAFVAGLDQHRPNLLLLVGRLAHNERAGDIGAIAVLVAERLDSHHIAGLDDLLGRLAVDDAAADSGADLVADGVGTTLQHAVHDFGADLQLA